MTRLPSALAPSSENLASASNTAQRVTPAHPPSAPFIALVHTNDLHTSTVLKAKLAEVLGKGQVRARVDVAPPAGSPAAPHHLTHSLRCFLACTPRARAAAAATRA
jgi:hypothetical protein